MYEQVKDIEVSFNKPYSIYGDKIVRQKRLIFYNFHYWKHLFVRYNLDIMHVEKKNMQQSYWNTFEHKKEDKDRVKALLDLVDMAIQLGLVLKKMG